MIIKKRAKLRNEIKDILCISVFYAIAFISVFMLCARAEEIDAQIEEQQKSTAEITAQTVQILER